MKSRKWFITLLIFVLTAALSIGAAAEGATAPVDPAAPTGPVCLSPDGVLSIQAPENAWFVVQDPEYWFILTDGMDMIMVFRQSASDALPAPLTADEDYEGVYQAYISTRNEVFLVYGLAAERDDLQALIRSIGTIRILKYDAALSAPVGQIEASRYGLRPVEADYYSVSEHLNVRASWSTNSEKLGYLTWGERIYVENAVTLDGKDCGWYQVLYNGNTAYVSAQLLSKTPLGEGEELFWFTVYAADGSMKSLFAAPDGTCWLDASGLEYGVNSDGLYYQIDTMQEYSADSEYWIREESENAASESFAVYAEDGTRVTLYPNPDGMYYDGEGSVYIQLPDALYYCEAKDQQYSVDPTFWHDEPDSPENDYSPVGNYFWVYPEYGQEREIRLLANGSYEDKESLLYQNIRGNLYYCTETDVLYSSDPNYWLDGEPQPDEGEEEDVTDYEEETDVTGEEGESAVDSEDVTEYAPEESDGDQGSYDDGQSESGSDQGEADYGQSDYGDSGDSGDSGDPE